MSNREDSVLDEIDRLVDESLAAGDLSDSFHGEQYREEVSCVWCGDGWHFLPVTQRMWEMRNGSYARDEFGYGIVDPDYDYRTDTSAVICPGSEFHGPIHPSGRWGKESRERFGQSLEANVSGQAYGESSPRTFQIPEPSLPAGRIRRIRFIGPFAPWTVAIDDDRVIEEIVSNPAIVGMPGPIRRVPIVREVRLTATFQLDHPVKDPSADWIRRNIPDIDNHTITAEGSFFHMRPIVIPFRRFDVYIQNPNQEFPDYVEFETSYQIERHPWFMEYWSLSGTEEDIVAAPVHRCCVECREEGHCACSGEHHILRAPATISTAPGRQGHESDYEIIDESYSFNSEGFHEEIEELRRNADEATQSSRGGRIVSFTTAEEEGEGDHSARGE